MIPGAPAPAFVRRLLGSAAAGWSVLLVRFPAGWERPEEGCYDVLEEFVILDGWLEMSGRRWSQGSYGLVPAGALRARTRSDGGALALAYFPGAPGWQPRQWWSDAAEIVGLPLDAEPTGGGVTLRDDSYGRTDWTARRAELAPGTEIEQLDVAPALWRTGVEVLDAPGAPHLLRRHLRVAGHPPPAATPTSMD